MSTKFFFVIEVLLSHVIIYLFVESAKYIDSNNIAPPKQFIEIDCSVPS